MSITQKEITRLIDEYADADLRESASSYNEDAIALAKEVRRLRRRCAQLKFRLDGLDK